MTYLDYNTSAPVRKEAIKAMDFSILGNQSFPVTKIGMRAKQAVEDARVRVAKALKVSPKNIYFTTKRLEDLIPQGRTAMQSTLHMSILKSRVSRILLVDSEGILKPFSTDSEIIIIEHANAETGVVQNLNFNKGNSKLVVDGTFGFGKTDLDLSNVDIYFINANAVEGPQEINVVYSKKSVEEWGSVALILAAAKAVELAAKEQKKNIKIWKKLQGRLIKSALKLPDVKLNGSRTQRTANNINIQIKNIEGEAMVLALDLKGIQCSTGSACSSKTLEASHVLLAMGQRPDEAHGSLRFTFGTKTTSKDIDSVIKHLPIIIKELRRITVN